MTLLRPVMDLKENIFANTIYPPKSHYHGYLRRYGGGLGRMQISPIPRPRSQKKSALDRANYYYDNRGARGLLLFTSIQIVYMPLVDTLCKSGADDFRIHALTPLQATSFNWFL